MKLITNFLKISSAALPRSRLSNVNEMDIEPITLADADPADADSLISTNAPDDLANEQTWPTEDEMQGNRDKMQEHLPDANTGTTPRRLRRVPKGTSEYQAAWIIDEEHGDEEDAESVHGNGENDYVDENVIVNMDEDARNGGNGSTDSDREEMEDLAVGETSQKMITFQDLDMEEETRQLVVTHIFDT